MYEKKRKEWEGIPEKPKYSIIMKPGGIGRELLE